MTAMHQALAAIRGSEDPETASVKRLLKLLDKTAKSNRTYGPTNPVAQRFAQQLFEELTGHLTTYSKLTFVVHRSELRYHDTVVYQTDLNGGADSFAFRLYADGIREVSIHQGLSQDDLNYFLQSLWADEQSGQDDDIVTRLWSRDLSTITLVTAEEMAQSSSEGASLPQAAGPPTSSDSTLRELLDRERSRRQREEPIASQTDAAGQAQRGHAGLVGFEVTEEELAALAGELEMERKRESLPHILEILTAILASESSPTLLTKLLNLWGDMIDLLFHQGQWTVLEQVVSLLHEAEALRPDLSEEHKQLVRAHLNGLGRPARLKAMEAYLNDHPDHPTTGLSTILSMMKPDDVPGLCSLLANLASPAHQAIVCDALTVLAQDNPTPLLKNLRDRRPVYVCNLLTILTKLKQHTFAEPVEKLIRHPNAQVRKAAVHAIGVLRPSGDGTKLLSLLEDQEESIRIAALKLLMTGRYRVSFSDWAPMLSGKTFASRSLSERRAIFLAVGITCGEEAVPYWDHLLTTWSWIGRKQKEEQATLAAEALGRLGTPPAIAALERGAKKGSAAVRQACAHSLSRVQQQRRRNQPVEPATMESPL